MYQVNEVVSLEGTLYRVLLVTGDQLIWIRIEDNKAFPSVLAQTEAEKLVLDEKLIRTEDPYSFLLLLSPEKGSKAAQKRDKYFKVIKPPLCQDSCRPK